jgi:hypothetical protein
MVGELVRQTCERFEIQTCITSGYQTKYPGNYSELHFLEYLAEKLEIRGYWAKVGLV